MKTRHITLAIITLAFSALGLCFLSGCESYQSHVHSRTIGAKGNYNAQTGESVAEIYDSVVYNK